MDKEMIKAYLESKDMLVHGNIVNVTSPGGFVMFGDQSDCKIHTEQHCILLFDIVVWVFSELKKRG